jgi:type II secretory pathway component GspD/PulD (secretin)
MNDLKERYAETALDELYNGGPLPELEARILHNAPAPVATGRWWPLPVACAALAALVTCVILLPNIRPDTATTTPIAVPTRDQQSAEGTPAGLGAKYKESTGNEPDAGKHEESGTPELDTAARISVDFVQKDIHVVMHYIALRTGLTIIVESEVDTKLTFRAHNQDARDLLRDVCRQNDLDYIEDGNVIVLKRRPTEGELAEITTPENDFIPNPEDPITIDFVQKDLHTVMHYIALRSGLQIIVEGEVDVKLTVMFRSIRPKQAIQSICKANKLDYIEDGNVIIIKTRPDAQSHTENSDTAGLFNVSFEEYDLVAAIMEVATVTKTQVLVPAITPHSDGSPYDEAETRILRMQEKKITLFMTLATPDQILRRLAELGEIAIELVESEGLPCYKFTCPE